MEYVIGKRQVVLNFSENFCKTESEVLNSNCFKDVWDKFVAHMIKTERQDMIKVFNLVPNPNEDYITLFKLLLSFSVEEIKTLNKKFEKAFEKYYLVYNLVENFYDYWRKLERYAVIFTRATIDGIESTSFTAAQSQFNNVVLSTYRTISEKLFGSKFPIYRQLPAGVNAALLISKHKWMSNYSIYSSLKDSEAIEQILIRPPFISYSDKNKRTGTYPEVFENPINEFKDNFKASEYYCYSAKVGSSLAYIYFYRDYLGHGITLCTLYIIYLTVRRALGAKSLNNLLNVIQLVGVQSEDSNAST